jgi:ABC-type multidrug transport system fused ATPase/permease subunit
MKNRKIITSVLTLCFAGLAYYFNDWTRLVFMILAGISTLLFSSRVLRIPYMLYTYFADKDPASISDQRFLDRKVLPAGKVLIYIVFIAIIGYCFISAMRDDSKYHPHWKSEINNMYANRLMGYVVNKVFPVKQYYSTKK